MFIVHVTPIVKGGVNKLSYFSSQEIPVGTIVYVPLRSKEVPALVIDREDAQTIKSILRTNIYETRKIRRQEPVHVFSAEFVRAANATAHFFATTTGSIIQSYTPSAILNAAEMNKLKKPAKQEKKKGGHFEKLVLQLSRQDRMEKYKMLIRTNFAQGRSIFLCTPTIREAKALKEYYERGIEKYTFLLDSSLTKKKQVETWESILAEKHPVLIVGTPTFASIPRNDLAMFILEHEMSSAYKQLLRPYADARTLIENLARETKSSLVYGGTTVSLKVQKELLDGEAVELEEHARKQRVNSTIEIVDARVARANAKEKKLDFPALAPESIQLLKKCVKKKGRSFVFAARRGIATSTVCGDCGTTVVCRLCTSPVVLHERNSERELLCHRCGSMRDAHETCATCESWNLVPLGIGIERVENFLRTNIPDAKVLMLSSDSAQTPTQAKRIIDEYYATPGSILVGTEMALAYLTEEISCSVMSSIDSLLCIPDFRIEEKIFGVIALLREQTKNQLLIETALPDNAMLKHAKSGSIAEYAKEELALREKLKYPPYALFIKISVSGSREVVIRDMKKFVDLTKKYAPRVFRGFIPVGRGSELNALIRIPVHEWETSELRSILESLPMSFKVDVRPERTL